MKYRELETVVLDRDVPEDGLRRGDLGTIVMTYEPDGIEVEFLAASGDTRAVVTLHVDDVRPASRCDAIAVRPAGPPRPVI